MSKWFIGKHFIEEEQRQLRTAEMRRERNDLLIKRDKEKLQKELRHEFGTLRGLSISFGAGCVAGLAYKNREHLANLKKLPWNEMLLLLQEYGALDQVPVEDPAHSGQ
tara:strand:- start:1272 stop:1595 length:324 start_codon:yes stop_codon:yes gene_type:complete